MDSNSKAYELVRNNIKNTLKDYEKIIHVNEDDMNHFDVEYLEKKFKKIEEKLSQSQDFRKNIKKEDNKKAKEKLTTNMNYDLSLDDDFRNFNIYIPKIKISETTKSKTTFFVSGQLYDDFKVDDSELFDCAENNLLSSDFNFKKLDKVQNYKPDPLFFSNKFIEFNYNDLSEKNSRVIRKNDNLIYNALKKKIDESLTASLYIANSKSPTFKIYLDLLKLEERSMELENNVFNRLKDDELIYDPKEENEDVDKKKKNEQILNINSRRSITEGGLNDKDKDKAYSDAIGKYKKWVLNKSGQKLNKTYKKTKESNIVNTKSQTNIITHNNESCIILPLSGIKIINLQSNDYGVDEKHVEDKYDTTSIAFGIAIQGIIEKKIRQTEKFHIRGILVEGPVATWFRFKNDANTHIVKGLFDLRKKENKMNFDDLNDKKIVIKKYQVEKSGKEVEKDVEFKITPFKEFSGKSFKEVFAQIRTYYHFLNTMKNRVDYTKLKYFSDPNIMAYFQAPLDSKYGLVENLDWHLKLKHLHLRGMDKTGLKNVFTTLLNSEIMLESLTLESGVNSANLSNISQYEFEAQTPIKNFFMNKTCENLTDIHFINFKFENGIKPLLDCLNLKFSYLKKKIGSDNKEKKFNIPYKNITIKRKEPALPTLIDLNELYSFFNTMSTTFGGISKFKTPFQKLDISGCDTSNIEGIKNLINNFKIIKEIDLSNTKYVIEKFNLQQNNSMMRSDKNNAVNLQPNNFLINNLEFLKSINIKHNFYNENSKNNLEVENSKSNIKSQSGFDYTNGLLPILETLYLFETPITNETFQELLHLFKKLKFFKGFHVSEHNYTNITENLKTSLFTSYLYEIYKESEIFCENVLEVELYEKTN